MKDGLVRSYASHYGHSLLDMNRQFCLIRDGRDYVGVPLHRAGVYNQSYIHDTTLIARDFTLKGDVASWPVGKVLSVKVGSGELDLVYITNTGGKYRVDAFCPGDKSLSGPIAPYVNLTTEIPVATGQTLDISVQNNTFTLFAGITQLLAGCRPGAQRIVSVPVLGSGGWAAGVLNISDTGVVTLASGDGSVMISLDGVKFAV